MSRAYVLLSGGIDSATCLHIACEEFGSQNVHALSVNYGQRHSKELEFAKQLSTNISVPHRTIDLTNIVPQTMLTDPNVHVPSISYDEIQGVSPTYVPFRNGLMLSAVASYVSGKYKRYQDEISPESDTGAEWAIYFGAHAEDARNWAYPDCTPEFIGAMANAIHVGTYYKIRLHTPLEWLRKKEIIEWGTRLKVPWHLTWSCYKGGQWHCGTCPTCRARRTGFTQAGIYDPTLYADDREEVDA